MTTSLRFEPVTALHPGMETLRAEAADEGFGFIERLMIDWESGSNRFDQPGECLLGVWSRSDLVALGGLNRDPYVEGSNTGRIRHLYVRRPARRSGVGSTLLQRLLDQASACFQVARLRTDTREAAAFYLRHGFLPVADHSASHAKILR
jgi:GNAT superfamily N-acetyltransferase